MLCHFDAFSGIGGFSLAAERADIATVGCSEIDPFAARVMRERFPLVRNFGDIRMVTGRNIVKSCGMINIITGGWPCTDHSVAGRRAGLFGPQSSLFFDLARLCREIVEEQNASVVLLAENVPGALSSQQGNDWAFVLDYLADCGAVEIGWRVLDAQYFGVAQRRKRVFLVADFGTSGSSQILFEPESCAGNPPAREGEGQEATPAVAGSLGGGSGARGWCSDTDRMTFVPEISPVLQARDHKGARPEASGATLIGFYHTNRQPEFGNYENVSPTLKVGTGSGGEPTSVAGELGVRRLTPTEAERLQGFPDGWTALPGVADGKRYKALGNAVAVPVVTWLMRRLNAHLMTLEEFYGI